MSSVALIDIDEVHLKNVILESSFLLVIIWTVNEQRTDNLW